MRRPQNLKKSPTIYYYITGVFTQKRQNKWDFFQFFVVFSEKLDFEEKSRIWCFGWNESLKLQIFWEGHKIWKHISLSFVNPLLNVKTKWNIFFKFCCLLTTYKKSPFFGCYKFMFYLSLLFLIGYKYM